MSDLHRLSGSLPPRWLGSLAYELARRGADVTSVRAALEGGNWTAEFTIDPVEGAPRFTDAELVRMTGSDASPESAKGTAPKITISSFEIAHEPDSIRVSLMGDDRVGFLAALCAHFAQLALFPVRVDVRSYAARAHDTFWLCGVGGALPLEETTTALRRLLRRMTGHPLSSRPPALDARRGTAGGANASTGASASASALPTSKRTTGPSGRRT